MLIDKVLSKKHIACIFLLFSTNLYALDKSDYLESMGIFSIDVVITQSEDFFDVYNKREDIDPIGSFFGNAKSSIALTLNSNYNYYNKSNAGYYFNYTFKTFGFDKQDTSISASNVTTTDLGTSVSGYNIAAYVALFYNVGDKFLKNETNTALKYGVEIGIGYLNAKGDIVLTERVGQPLMPIDVSGFGLTFGLFVDYRYGPWLFRVEVLGTEGAQSGIPIDYTTIPLQIGYSFVF